MTLALRASAWSWVAAAVGAGLALLLIDDPRLARASALAVAALALWLGEAVPVFVPTLLLAAAIPVVMPAHPDFTLGQVLAAGANPVLTLFLGGMVMAAAAQRHGLDRALSSRLLRAARGSPLGVMAGCMAASAGLSMWMSNVAATAMMLVVAMPLLASLAGDAPLRRAVLLGIAIGANLGGMATPIGTGPNALAITAAAAAGTPIAFAQWMLIALPPTIIALVGVGALIAWSHGVARAPRLAVGGAPAPLDRRGQATLALAGAMIAAWLTGPLHGLPIEIIALIGAAAFFATGLLAAEDLARLDWATLLLIAGGLILGDLLGDAGVLRAVAEALRGLGLGHGLLIAALIALAALASAVMSNTGTATLLIPLGMTVAPDPGTAVLIALGCSLGFPFAISTPPNAMVVAQGVRSRDLLLPGAVTLVVGVALAAWLGPWWLRLAGVG